MKTGIKNLLEEDLFKYFEKIGEKKFRVKQLFNAIYSKRVSSFSEISNFSNTLQEQLEKDFYINCLELKDKIISTDGSIKFIFTTLDNKIIETIFLPNNNTNSIDNNLRNNTLCISTMIGCPVNCKFCATARLGYERSLDVSEILEQILYIQNYSPEIKIRNAVFMGMGEPFLNYDNTVKAIKIIRQFTLLKNITISTIGIPDKIAAFANTGLKIKIALSLHSPFDEIRENLIPISKKYKIEEILKALDYYYHNIHLPITIEYILFKGLNDRDEDVKKLARITRRFPSIVNLIPYNDISFIDNKLDLIPANDIEIRDFARKLYDENITVITRKSQGKDIAAACGMLAYNNQNIQTNNPNENIISPV